MKNSKEYDSHLHAVKWKIYIHSRLREHFSAGARLFAGNQNDIFSLVIIGVDGHAGSPVCVCIIAGIIRWNYIRFTGFRIVQHSPAAISVYTTLVSHSIQLSEKKTTTVHAGAKTNVVAMILKNTFRSSDFQCPNYSVASLVKKSTWRLNIHRAKKNQKEILF